MREILFRGWDLNLKRWLKGHELQQCLILNFSNKGKDDDVVNIDEFNEENGYAYDLGTNLDLMQFTGLMDKNGKRIFEGDIVKTTAKFNDHHQEGAIDYTCVKSFMGNFCLCFNDNESGAPIYPLNVTCFLEVTGNIYDDPDYWRRA